MEKKETHEQDDEKKSYLKILNLIKIDLSLLMARKFV